MIREYDKILISGQFLPGILELGSCPWGMATAYGPGIPTEIYVIYMERRTSGQRVYLFKVVTTLTLKKTSVITVWDHLMVMKDGKFLRICSKWPPH